MQHAVALFPHDMDCPYPASAKINAVTNFLPSSQADLIQVLRELQKGHGDSRTGTA